MAVETQAVPTRAEIPIEFQWDIRQVYENDGAWEQAVADLEAKAPRIVELEGVLSRGPAELLQVLRASEDISKQLYQIGVYATMRKDQDGTDPTGQALESRAGSLAARISAALSFIEPEILALPPETVERWQREQKELEPYAYYLDRLMRRRPHIRSAEVESVVAQLADVTRGPQEIADVLTNTDLQFPEIEDEEGRQVQLSNARYSLFMSSKDRRVRRDTFLGVHRTYRSVQRTLATSLSAGIREAVVQARLRSYRSSLEAALHANDIPVEVYHNLVRTVNESLPHLHRYMRVRKRLLGVGELRYYDMYAPLVPEVADSFEYGAAQQLVREAFRPLGGEYAAALERGLNGRWIDVYENVGKQGGAYSDGSYTTPPFILLNYQGRLEDVYTLAHELGHSLHSFFTRESQPYVSGGYTIFVAEVSSTVNEALLTAHLLSTTDDRALRKSLIVRQLETMRTTLFRQAMFAELELEMHRRIEAGEALTADDLSAMYRELVARYHGPELVIDDEVAVEWARITHFYAHFYVYQYATGISAALALSSQILEQGKPAVERYLRFLSSGSSRPSIELLRDAGVDMATPVPIQSAMERFDALLDELEALG